MYDDAIDPYDVGMRELSRRLEAFADTRLTPSLSGTSRMRTNVMKAAQRRAALIAADRTFDAVAPTTAGMAATVPALVAERSRFAMPAWRRPMAALAAGALMLALVGGTASAANAGGPLYAARIWIEMTNLPAGALARADAEITRLDARLREAQQAYTDGDGAAAEAALLAYTQILTEAVQGSSADAAASAAIESSLTRHVADLELMVATVSPTGQGAVRHALASSTMVLQDLDDAILQESHDGQSRQGDDVLGPTGTKLGPPTKDPAAAPAAAPEATPKPAKTEAPYTGGHGYGNEGTPPGHAEPKGTSHPDPTARPSDKSSAPKSGGT